MCTIKLNFQNGKVTSYSQDYNVCSKWPPFSQIHARDQTRPLSNSSLCASVVEVMPLFDKTLLKVVDIVDAGTVDSSL